MFSITQTHTASLVHATEDGEKLIAKMARVSNPANQDNTQTSARLIRYLIEHKHWSPFEMVNMCVSIETTRAVAAQLLRHRSFSFQEFSQRYARVMDLPQVPELRRQDEKNRQNSIDDLDPAMVNVLQYDVMKHYGEAYRLYQKLLDAGVAKECARDVLPMAAPTTLYMNGSLRSWLHYVDLRSGNGTQKEHALIAQQIKRLLVEQFPTVCEAMWGES